MFRALFCLSATLMALSLTACDDAPRFTKAEPGESRSGGATTVNKRDQNAFFPALGQPGAYPPPGFQRRQQFLSQPLGDRALHHHGA